MRVFIGMETSGVMRRAFQKAGHDAVSCDLLPAQDGETKHHHEGDIFEVLSGLSDQYGWWPDVAMFHPDCTYLTVSAAWAFKDGPYHQKVKPGTLVGKERREAREKAVELVRRIQILPIKRKIIENPIGSLSSLWMKPSQIVQPYEFGDDASKATCLWFLDEDGNKVMTRVDVDPSKRLAGRIVNGVERWSNQTDSGQNRLSPSANRWQERADTYPGIAAAIVGHFGG